MPNRSIDNKSHFAFTHIDIFNGEEILKDQYLEIKDNNIIAIEAMQAVNKITIPHQDFQGLLATAGFIDLQLNGCGGVLLNSETNQQTLNTINQTNLKFGTTQYLPTLVTSSKEQMIQAIELIASLDAPQQQGILGLHLEGPFINPQKKGAHPERYIRQLDRKTALYLAQHSQFIKVITLAPECVTQEVINILREAGIIISIGHSNATYQQLEEKKGMQMATHLFNAMSPLTSREPGVVGYVFNHKPFAGIIADGIHVDYATLRLAHDHLGEKLFMVTDAVTPAGTDLSHFELAGTEAFVTNGKCHFADGTIAGAAITMDKSINNLIEYVGLSREEALRMATLYPAKAINIDHEYGRIALGYKANITLLNAANEVQAVYQMGRQQ